jgi:uncharacterized protein YbaR (Trm112 family)
MLSRELLEILVCPACKQALELQTTTMQGMPAERLKCTNCRRVYPVRDGLPIMLVDEATIEEVAK